MNKNFTVLITGTSKGLGYDLVKLFLNNNPNSMIIATSRQDPKDAYSRWQELDQRKQIDCKKLQILSKESIDQFAKQIQKEHVKFDIVVNNAGIASIKDSHDLMPDLQLAKHILKTNTIGTIQLTKSILPFMSQSCRIINVSSLLGALKFHPEHTQKRFSDPNITEEDIINGVHEYLKENEQRKINNWSPGAYITSKMLLNAWSRFILQKELLSGNQKAICVAPGFCRTPMTKDFPSSPWEYSSESGAIRIYETIFLENLDSEIFYHRARKSDYFRCGEGLPYDPIK